MTVHGACRSGGTPPGLDWWIATNHGIVVLDGATAFDPDGPTADRYVDVLLIELAHRLDAAAALTAILHDAIAAAGEQLGYDRAAVLD